MSAIFVDQPYTLTLEVNQAMAGASAEIAYRKPDGTTGTWSASINGTQIYHDVTAAENDVAGFWHFQSSVTFSGDTVATLGATATKQILAAYTFDMLTLLKSETFLNKSETTDDDDLTMLLVTIVEQVKDYCDDEDLDWDKHQLIRAVCKQAAYEWTRKRDLGVQSVQYPDGSVTKFSVNEWLPEVKQVIDRYRTFTFGA